MFMTLSAFWLVRLHNLFAVVMLSGTYSLFAASLYLVMDAVDVAFTEAAVGAGIATVLMLGTLGLIGKPNTKKPKDHNTSYSTIALVFITGGVLMYGTLDMPRYGDANAPDHQHVANRYIAKSADEVGPPNMVTSVLASYRGYDTLGETAVVFTAAIGVLAILGRAKGQTMPTSIVARRPEELEPEEPPSKVSPPKDATS